LRSCATLQQFTVAGIDRVSSPLGNPLTGLRRTPG